jgi:phosphoribosylaminoimidazolecarboxamide formyltransferase/IMP cyclohydrolase
MTSNKKRALISVFRKEGIAELGKGLTALGFEILSTGGTATALLEASVPVTPVSDVTGFPEILSGRVKTLHPKVFGGILAKRNDEHLKDLADTGLAPIDVVVVNLYPFEDKIAKGASFDEAIENIDIGGPSMLRAAAKNFQAVAVVVDSGDYGLLLEQLGRPDGIDVATRLYFAQKAFRHTARYETAIAAYFAEIETTEETFAKTQTDSVFPYRLNQSFEKIQDLRYGENPHQRAAFYSDMGSTMYSVAAARVLQGKELSFNNILDLDAAWRLVTDVDGTACAIIKHTNPCGVGRGVSLEAAFTRAWDCDPTSAFGGIVALSTRCDAAVAAKVAGSFFEALIAPGFSAEAKEILAAKKNLRVLDMDVTSIHRVTGFDQKRVMGGILAQEWDMGRFDRAACDPVSKRKPTPAEWEALGFAWNVAKHVKSNAIVFSTAEQTVGIGAGQMSRIDSVKFAISKAQLPLKGTVVASDGFFPFRDNVDAIAKTGATAIIQPGGSVKDEEVVKAADELGLSMVFTGKRHFKH